MKNYRLQIVTPDRVVYDGNASSLSIRTTEGNIQILAGHVDLIAAIGIGKAVFVTEDGTVKTASAAGGFLTVTKDTVRVLATTFELAEEIDLNRAKEAQARAEAALGQTSDEAEEKKMKIRLARALNRISVVKGDH